MQSNTICFIPIKTTSKRVPGKNFKVFAGFPLYKHIITNAIRSGVFDEIYIDTDSDEIKEFASQRNCKIIDRPEYMTKDNINGNDLLLYDYNAVKKGEFLFQLFATAPLLRPETIRACVNFLKRNSEINDSIFTATDEGGWFWFNDVPVNYSPYVLPRSQDAQHLIKESTGLYGITKETLIKYKCRIGARPFAYKISKFEALDIDDEKDFKLAELAAKIY